MLLADPADGNFTPCRVGEGKPEDPFGLEDALRVMAQRTVGEDGEMLLGGIEPVMNRLIVGWLSAILPGRAFGMMEG
ncbi:hypothetical protein GKC28_18145 [Leisingera sp. ANG59]|nr:hypothetical protein [Leisingera sp. ANG59]NSY40152.1 hypothetical protein [Leisingera sp. ANG59]